MRHCCSSPAWRAQFHGNFMALSTGITFGTPVFKPNGLVFFDSLRHYIPNLVLASVILESTTINIHLVMENMLIHEGWIGSGRTWVGIKKTSLPTQLWILNIHGSDRADHLAPCSQGTSCRRCRHRQPEFRETETIRAATEYSLISAITWSIYIVSTEYLQSIY